MSYFQTITLAIFGLIILAAVLLFSAYAPGGGRGEAPELVVWGSFPQDQIDALTKEFNDNYRKVANLKYVEVKRDFFEQELIEALASARGPDLIFLPQELVYRQKNKLEVIPFSQLSRRTFADMFVDSAQIYLGEEGVLALPFNLDPLVLYWNKDIFSAAGLAKPPSFWDEVVILSEKLTEKDQKGNITQSAIAMGGYDNISHAKEIIASLALQVGDQIVPNFGRTVEGDTAPTESAMRFYTEFGNPAKTVYSWNSGLANSEELFTTGTLAMYIGKASDYDAIARLNPHLNFDVALLPQIRPSALSKTVKTNFGAMTGLAILKSSPYKESALNTAFILSGDKFASLGQELLKLPSASRAILSQAAENPNQEVYNKAALIARNFYDPAPRETYKIFRQMIQSILTGLARERDAIAEASSQIQALFR